MEPFDLELRLGPPATQRRTPISDQSLQAWESFLKKRTPSTEVPADDFHNETLSNGFLLTLIQDLQQLYKEAYASQACPRNSKWKKVILKLTEEKGNSYKKYCSIIQDLEKGGAESESFKDLLEILSEFS